MLGRLIKHEFRSTAPFMAMLFVALLVSSGLTMLLRHLTGELGIVGGIAALPGILSTIVYVILAASSSVLVYAAIIRRFWTHCFGDEGYLTLMLPVSRTKLILSKLITSVVWSIAGGIVLIASILIITFPEVNGFLAEIFRDLSGLISYLEKSLSTSFVLLAIELCVLALVEVVSQIVTFYAAMAIGQLFLGHPIIGSLISYGVLNGIIQFLDRGYLYLLGFTYTGIEGMFTSGAPGIAAMESQIMIVLYLVMQIAVTAALFLLTRRIMRKSINLK